MILFHHISELLTLASAAAKKGKHVSESDLDVIRDAAFVVDQGRIAWVGKSHELPSSLSIESRVDLGGADIAPGFVECHTHSIFSGSRAAEFERRLQGATYQEIAREGGGILSTVQATRAATLSELTQIGQRHADAFTRQGVTTLEIKSGYALNETDEFKMLEAARAIQGPRIITTYLGPHARSPDHANLDDYLNTIIGTTLPQLKQRGLADRVDIFIDDGFFTVEQGTRYVQAAAALELPIVIHAHQLGRTGAVQLAIKANAHSAEHLIQLNINDIKELAASETVCVLLPTADLYMQMSYPPARELIDNGASVALATDFNPGTSPSNDLGLVGVLARLKMKMSLPEIISAYTVGGALALRQLQKVGSLEVGKCADFAVLNRSWRELFYSVGSMNVQETWVAGQKLKNS